DPADQGALPDRDRGQRRPTRAGCQERAEGDLRARAPAGRGRGLYRDAAWVVSAGFEGLRPRPSGEGLGPTAGAAQKRVALKSARIQITRKGVAMTKTSIIGAWVVALAVASVGSAATTCSIHPPKDATEAQLTKLAKVSQPDAEKKAVA